MWSPCGVCKRWFTELNEHFRCQRFARKLPQKKAKWVRISGKLTWDQA